MRDIIVENYWDKGHCHYSSIQEIVDYYIQSHKEDSIGYAFKNAIQFNTRYRNYLQDNGFPALIERLKSETQYMEQTPEVMQKLEDWWKYIQREGGLGEYDIQCYHHTDAFSLFGEQVNGIDGLNQIIQVSGEAGPFSKNPILSEPIESGCIFSDRRNNTLSLLYAALLWESYPRFDISDYSDNRKYRCYYISNQPFNDNIFKNSRDGGMEHLNENIPLSRLPLVYDKGDSSVIYVLTPRKK